MNRILKFTGSLLLSGLLLIGIVAVAQTGYQDFIQFASGVAWTAGDRGTNMHCLRKDTAAAPTGVDNGDVGPCTQDGSGAIWMALRTAIQMTNLIPSSGGTWTDGGDRTLLSPATAGDNQIVAAGGASVVTRVFGANICNRDATTDIEVIWRSGSSPVSIPYPIAHGTCLIQALRTDSWAKTGANAALNLNVSSAVNVAVQSWTTSTNP